MENKQKGLNLIELPYIIYLNMTPKIFATTILSICWLASNEKNGDEIWEEHC